jgi:hypothetical protein
MSTEEFKKKYKDSFGVVIVNHRSSGESFERFKDVLIQTKYCSDDVEVHQLEGGIVAMVATEFYTGPFFKKIMHSPKLFSLGVKFDTVYSFCRM